MSSDESTNVPLDPQDSVIAGLLDDVKPVPARDFRGALARRLAAEDPGWGPRPAHLWPQALALVVLGVLLLLIGALISVGGI